MSRRYRVLLPVLIDGEYGQGDEFEKDLTEDQEAANLQSGLLEVVPVTYKVLGPSRVYETNPGDTFTKALTIGQERHLVEGGFIERADPPSPQPKAKKKEA